MTMIGEKIRVLRIKRGYSQAQLADIMNLKRSAISNYEQGIREPDLDTVEAFADFFQVSIADLIGRDETDYLHGKISSITEQSKDDSVQTVLHDNHDEYWQIREDFRRNPQLRTLHDLQRNATNKELKQMEAFIRAIRSGESDE